MNTSSLPQTQFQNDLHAAKPTHAKTILVVDDDESVRELTQFWLESEGYEVIMAKNGSEAIDRLKSVRTISAIILDVQMPVMNGNEVLDEMRMGGFLEKTPVLIVSANRQVHAERDAYQVLLKPVAREQLLTSIKESLKVSSLRRR